MALHKDMFDEIARYYDPIMAHVDYDRWFMVVTELSAMLEPGFRHLDAACGTGVLLKMLRRTGWRSMGIDLSHAMLRAAGKNGIAPPAAVADMRALPFAGAFDYVTCLFDSMNFLVALKDVQQALHAFYAVMAPNSLLYFDVVTERMVQDHYADDEWIEDNGRFTTTWRNHYDHKRKVIICDIRVNTGRACHLIERIYRREQLEHAATKAGFRLLHVCDAHAWRPPTKKTVRMDFLAVKGDPGPFRKQLKAICTRIRKRL